MLDSKPKLTADLFYKFFQCPHWIWYDIYGDSQHRKATPPILEMIYRGKPADIEHHIREHKKFEEIKPELYRDLDEAFMATMEMMKDGKNIYHGVLMHENWVGIPDLLEKRPGKSDLGDFHYVVYDIRSTLDIRDENKFQLVFYSLILERLQGVRPKEAFVIDPSGNERAFRVDDFVDQFHITREQIEKILNGEKPAPFLKSGCKRTPWYSLCIGETEGCNDVSLIYKISQADQRRLYNIGIRTVDDMAHADIDDINVKLEDWPYDKLVRFNNQARSLVSQQPIILRKNDFPEVRYDIYFDIESDPTRDIDYLLGFLIKDNKTGKSEYKYFLAKSKEEEEKAWKECLNFLSTLEDFVIYHYAFYEQVVFDKLASRYGVPEVLSRKFKDNTIDLHLRLVDSVVLPLYFYSLKDVGKYLGYTWDDPEAGGAESIIWYNNWLDKKDEAALKRIIKYNEDDVRATMIIKEWLSDKKPTKQKDKKESLPME
jgi:predicted RecB family nuclease